MSGIASADQAPHVEQASKDVLSGRYVDLRPLREADAALTLRWRLGERAALLNRGAETVEAQARWIATRPADERNYIIELKDGTAVGMLSLIGIDMTHRRAEPARFLIGEEACVKGIPVAVEAMLLLYELAFERLGLERLHGVVVSGNPLMVQWQKYFGMKEEGRLRRHYRLNGAVQDGICLGLLIDEYRSTARPRMRSIIALTQQGKGVERTDGPASA